MTREDGQKLVDLLMDDASPFCTCEVCVRQCAQMLAIAFPELHWQYEERQDGSCEATLLVQEKHL